MDASVAKIHELVKAGRRAASAATPNTTLLRHLVHAGASYRAISAMDALYGKVWASDIDKMGIHEIAETEDGMELGYEANLASLQSFRPFIQFLSQGSDIKTNWQVKEINYIGSTIQLRSQSGALVLASRVVISVPASVLKDGDIKFIPDLPEPKKEAIQKLGFGPALKVVLKFRKRFVPENMHLIMCADSTFPQLWMDGGAARGTPDVHSVTAFTPGDCAQVVSKMDDKEKVLAFLQQLDQMFGTSAEPRPATNSFVDSLVYDWGKQPFIRGGYSFPLIGSKGIRSKVARVRGNRYVCAFFVLTLGACRTCLGSSSLQENAQQRQGWDVAL